MTKPNRNAAFLPTTVPRTTLQVDRDRPLAGRTTRPSVPTIMGTIVPLPHRNPPRLTANPTTDPMMTTVTTTTTTFEPMLPDTYTLYGMIFTVVMCVLAVNVWNNDVVPVSRAKLSVSKHKGEVKEYLDELRLSANVTSTAVDSDSVPAVVNTTDETVNVDVDGDVSSVTALSSQGNRNRHNDNNNNNDRALERWLFADWLNRNPSEQKAAAIPFLKKAKWNSGDNPVVVTAGFLLVCILVASVTERAGMMTTVR